ncbi:MAG: hypothetical protein KF726_23460 [Anaerolineae bacterium]|nr:hypothetical protein [Anaerolineae bacterium]
MKIEQVTTKDAGCAAAYPDPIAGATAGSVIVGASCPDLQLPVWKDGSSLC